MVVALEVGVLVGRDLNGVDGEALVLRVAAHRGTAVGRNLTSKAVAGEALVDGSGTLGVAAALAGDTTEGVGAVVGDGRAGGQVIKVVTAALLAAALVVAVGRRGEAGSRNVPAGGNGLLDGKAGHDGGRSSETHVDDEMIRYEKLDGKVYKE